MATDLMFKPVLDDLLTALCSVIVAQHSNPPAQCVTRPGDSMLLDVGQNEDECCEGIAWVRLDGATPGWPDQDQTPHSCGVPAWRAEIEMGIARCAPVGGVEEGASDAAWLAVSDLLLEDFAIMRRALCDFREGKEVIVGGYAPIGPNGGCVGGSLTLSVQVITCDECV